MHIHFTLKGRVTATAGDSPFAKGLSCAVSVVKFKVELLQAM